jgi:ubiquinone/menaquinone biosynthesis C-methylase UbiE
MDNKQSESQHVFKASKAGHLDNWFRCIVQNPDKIIGAYVKYGMTVIDLGCGTGFFSIPTAKAVGEYGKVIAVDIQVEMLEILKSRIKDTLLESRFYFQNDLASIVNGSIMADFVLAAYVFHELPDQANALYSIRKLLGSGGLLLIIEPDFIVSKKAFQQTIDKACQAGFEIVKSPDIFLSKSIVLKKI